MLNQQIGQYKIISKLGEGGMANVYLAEKGSLGKKVALKVLKDEFLLNKHVRGRFLSEARKMISLNHPNIVGVHDLIDDADFVAIELDYIEGKTLKQHLQEKGALPDDEIEHLFKQMLNAVGYVHEKGFIHRDIKPSNFMLTDNGIIKLTDFGIAKSVDDSNKDYTGTGTGMQMGTPKYMSPEQVRSTKDVDHKTDIYSLGVVLWEMVTGRVPYDIATESTFDVFRKIVDEPLVKTNSKWDEIIQKATKKEVGERYANVEGIVWGKEKVNTQEPISSKKTIKYIVAAVLLLVIAITIFQFVKSPNYKKERLVTAKIESDQIKADTTLRLEKRQKLDSLYIKKYDTIESIQTSDKDSTKKDEDLMKMYDYTSTFSGGLARVKLNNKWGAIDKNRKEVIPLKYDYIQGFSEGLAKTELNNKYGFIDMKGNEVTSFKYDGTDDFRDGMAPVRLNDKTGYIDKEGNEVIPIKYDEMDHVSEGLIKVKLNEKVGFIDKTGEIIIPIKYDFGKSFSGTSTEIVLNGKWGSIDKKGNTVIPFIYEYIWPFSEGLAGVKLNDKWGYVNRYGNEITSIKYNWVDDFSEGLACVKLNNKWGYIDKMGKLVIPIKYDFTKSMEFSEGEAQVKMNGVEFYIDKKGKCVRNCP